MSARHDEHRNDWGRNAHAFRPLTLIDTAPISPRDADARAEDDYEPALYTQSQMDAAGVRIGALVSLAWTGILGALVGLLLALGH